MTERELIKIWAKVTGKFNELIDGAPEALNTLKKIADKLGDDDDALAGLLTQVGSKQDSLVSGQNIKTVNGNSLLGEGNLELGELFVVRMTRNNSNSVYTADKSVSEIYEASYTNRKPVIAVMRDINNPIFILTDCDPDGDSYVFSSIESNTVTTLRWQRSDDYTYELETIVLQPHLVSGTNIKTVNNESLLGSGNVDIVGKSAYQSYVDTTTDSPVKTEAEWVASLKGEDGVSLGEVAIADNLTTDDATKVLSAKQGYLLGQKVNDVDDVPTAGSEKFVKSGGVQNELALGAVYDVSAKNPTAGINNDGKWESLSALLSDANLNTLIPTSVRKGGMSVKFVQSSDNKYVQARCMAQNFTTDVTQWQGVDDEPTAGSDNLVKSSGVVKVKLFEQKALVASTGNLANSVAGYNVTQFLRVKEGLVIPCTSVSGNRASVCFYDSNYQFIDGGNISVSSASDVTLTSNNIPQNAAYFRAVVPDNAVITGASMDTISGSVIPVEDQQKGDYVLGLHNGKMTSVVPSAALSALYYKLNGYYIRLDGTVNSSSVSGYCATLFIKVRDGISIDCKYITGENNDGLGLGVCFYNSDFNPIAGSIIIDADTTVTLSSSNIPANARYFRANIVSNKYVWNIAITDIVTSLVKAGTSNPRIGTVLGIGNGNLAFTPKDVIVNELVTVQEVAIIPGKFLRVNGNINSTTASNYNITPYLPVRVGFSISCRYVATDGGPAVLFYDEFFNFIQSGTIFIDSSKTVVLTDANIPAGAVYFRANVVDGYQPMPYFYPYDNLQKLASAISGYLPTYAMAGKKYCNLGSSTSAASWHRDTIAALGMTFEKFSIGGAHFYCGDNAAYNLNEVAADSPDNVIMNQIGRLFNKNINDGYYPDIITLLSGLNDCYGEVTTTFEQAMAADISEYDTPQLWFTAPSAIKNDSIINLRAVIEMLSAKFPLSQLIIMTYQHVYSNSFNQDSLQHFHDVEKQIAAYYAIPVIDFYSECGWNEITASSFAADGTHPNVAGSKMMSNFLKTALVRTVSLRQ